jgi:antitoxin StbD
MTSYVLSDMTASVSELKANPMHIVESAGGEAIAILNRNKPAFYCVPAKIYEAMMEMLDDKLLAEIVRERAGQKEILVKLDEL